MKPIDKDALIAEIEKRLEELYKLLPDASKVENGTITISEACNTGKYTALETFKDYIDSLEVKEVDISNISENLAEAYEYLDYTSTGNLAHNKPMVSARLKKAIRGLFDAGLFELTHDEKYRMEKLGLKAQKGKEL